jgi:hypothetical protein
VEAFSSQLNNSVMKTIRNFLGLFMVGALMIGVTTLGVAQGKSQSRGHGHNKENPGRGHDKKDNDHGGRYVTYNHHHRNHPSWAPLYGHRYNTRYIYYRDYNVYYDCHRDMFITWTGRRWVVSAFIPAVMVRVDFNRARVSGVDYWNDDFNFYLARQAPRYVSIQVSF